MEKYVLRGVIWLIERKLADLPVLLLYWVVVKKFSSDADHRAGGVAVQQSWQLYQTFLLE